MDISILEDIGLRKEDFELLPDKLKTQLINRELEKRKELEYRINKEKENLLEKLGSYDEFSEELKNTEFTTSTERISYTREYLETREKLLKQMSKGEINSTVVETTLANFIKDTIRKHKNERKKTKKQNIGRSVRFIKQKGIIQKSQTEIRTDNLESKDLEKVTSQRDEDFYVFIPNKNTILREFLFLEEQQKLSCFWLRQITIRFVSNNRFPSNTRLIYVDERKDTWFEELTDVARKKLDIFTDPEIYDSTVESINIVTRLKITSKGQECILSWYDKQPLLPIIKFEDFELFIARDLETNCVEQCVEFLGRKFDKKKECDIVKQLEGTRVKLYSTIVDIKHLKNFSQLVEITDTESDKLDVADDCKNIVRVLEFKNHIGVITCIKRKVSFQYLEKQSMQNTNEEYNEVFIDIETFIETETNKIVPYVVCWKDINKKEISSLAGENCIEMFIESIISSYKKVILYAWNGASFDFQLIIGILKRHSIKEDIVIRDNKILYSNIKTDRCKIVTKDPYLFIPKPLTEAARDFGSVSKSNFPHNIVKSYEDLDKVIERWFHIREEIFYENDTENQKVKIFKARDYKEFETRRNHKTILEKAIEYCKIDVICCEQIWMKFTETLENIFTVKISKKIFTLPQYSFKIVKSTLPEKVKLCIPSSHIYDFIKESIYGGRVVAKKGRYTSKNGFALLDVVSLYPTAMYNYEQPHGTPYITNKIRWERLGVYRVKLTSTNKDNYIEFLPFRKNNKLEYSFREQWEGIYNTYDLKIAKETGYEIEVIEGYEYPYKEFLFKTFIEKVFKLKKESSGCLRTIAKLALNAAGFGKFIQKPINDEVLIVPRGYVQSRVNGSTKFAGRFVGTPEFYELDEEWDKMIIKKDGENRYPTQIGSFILSAARYYMKKIVNELNTEVLYSDTDSLLIDTDKISEEKIKKYIGNELGQLTDNICNIDGARAHTAIIIGPKSYYLTFTDPEYGIDREHSRFKGLSSKYNSKELFNHLIESEDSVIKAEMCIMKRNLVNISSIKIMKQIQQ